MNAVMFHTAFLFSVYCLDSLTFFRSVFYTEFSNQRLSHLHEHPESSHQSLGFCFVPSQASSKIFATNS